MYVSNVEHVQGSAAHICHSFLSQFVLLMGAVRYIWLYKPQCCYMLLPPLCVNNLAAL